MEFFNKENGMDLLSNLLEHDRDDWTQQPTLMQK